MVDSPTLARINELYAENRDVSQAIASFDAGGRIMDMSVGPRMIRISTVDLQYPPQMVDAIKAALTVRRDAIRAELGQLGFTGDLEPPVEVETGAGGAPEPEPESEPGGAA